MLGIEVGTVVVPLLVPCDFANVDIVLGASRREEAGSLEFAKEERAKGEGPGYLFLCVVYLLDLMLKQQQQQQKNSR